MDSVKDQFPVALLLAIFLSSWINWDSDSWLSRVYVD